MSGGNLPLAASHRGGHERNAPWMGGRWPSTPCKKVATKGHRQWSKAAESNKIHPLRLQCPEVSRRSVKILWTYGTPSVGITYRLRRLGSSFIGFQLPLPVYKLLLRRCSGPLARSTARGVGDRSF